MSSCGMALEALHGPDDACSNTVRGLITHGVDDLSPLYEGDCFSRFEMWGTGCRSVVGDFVSFVLHVYKTVLVCF